jgi:CRISPR-associated protein Cmr5
MLNRDQQRAPHAYQCVAKVSGNLKEYKIFVNGLGPNIIRSGLVAAIAFIQRNRSDLRDQFASDIASGLYPQWEVPTNLPDLAKHVREVPHDQYMLLTREILRLSLWFKRAVQAHDSSDTNDGGNQHAN